MLSFESIIPIITVCINDDFGFSVFKIITSNFTTGIKTANNFKCLFTKLNDIVFKFLPILYFNTYITAN